MIFHDTVKMLNQATVASQVAVGTGVVATLAFPWSPITTLCATLAAGVVAYRTTITAEKRRREDVEWCRPRWFRLDTDSIPVEDPDEIYLGEGYVFTDAHRQVYDRRIAPHKSFPIARYRNAMISLGIYPEHNPKTGKTRDQQALEIIKAEGGDPRFLGMGWRETHSVTLKAADLCQHMSVWGATGSGKTRAIETPLAWITKQGHGLLIIDPKGDPPLTDLAWSLADKHKRGWTWVSLSNPEVSATYNPLLSYGDPAELFTRVKTLVPENPTAPFWTDTPGQAAGSALVVQGWARRVVQTLGSTGAKPAALYVALAYAANLAHEQQRDITVQDIRDGWDFANSHPIQPVDDRSEGGAYRLTEDGLAPSLATLYRFAVDEPRTVVAIATKTIAPHLWIGQDPDQLKKIELERTAAAQKDAPKGVQVPLQLTDLADQVHQLHPFEDGYAGPDWVAELWRPLIGKRDEIIHAVQEIRQNCERTVLPWSTQTDEERKRYCSSLQTALGGFVGRWNLVAAPKSDLDLQRVVTNGDVAYVALNTLALGATAEAFAKVLIADIAALAGRTNAQASNIKRKRVFVLIDEVASFATKDLVRILQQARSAGVSIVTLGQSRSALEKALGDAGQVKDFLGNMLITVQLRAGTEDEAKEFTKGIQGTNIERAQHNVGVSPALGSAGHGQVSLYSSNAGQTMSVHETKLIPDDMVMDLPKGCAIVVMDRIPRLVQFPQVINKSGKSWYEQLSLPLPDWYQKKLEDAGQPIPEWHYKNLEAQSAKKEKV